MARKNWDSIKILLAVQVLIILLTFFGPEWGVTLGLLGIVGPFLFFAKEIFIKLESPGFGYLLVSCGAGVLIQLAFLIAPVLIQIYFFHPVLSDHTQQSEWILKIQWDSLLSLMISPPFSLLFYFFRAKMHSQSKNAILTS